MTYAKLHLTSVQYFIKDKGNVYFRAQNLWANQENSEKIFGW